MTIDELQEHCERVCNPNGKIFFDDKSKTYQEHKLVLDIIEELKCYRKGFTEARNKDYETAYAKGFNDGCAKFSVSKDYDDGYKNGIDDFQEWLKTQVVGLDNTTKEILVVEYDTWVLAVDKFKEEVKNG